MNWNLIIAMVVVAVVASILVWVIDRYAPPFELKWLVRLVIVLAAVLWICYALLKMAGVA